MGLSTPVPVGGDFDITEAVELLDRLPGQLRLQGVDGELEEVAGLIYRVSTR